jgi:hypothetical protein
MDEFTARTNTIIEALLEVDRAERIRRIMNPNSFMNRYIALLKGGDDDEPALGHPE